MPARARTRSAPDVDASRARAPTSSARSSGWRCSTILPVITRPASSRSSVRRARCAVCRAAICRARAAGRRGDAASRDRAARSRCARARRADCGARARAWRGTRPSRGSRPRRLRAPLARAGDSTLALVLAARALLGGAARAPRRPAGSRRCVVARRAIGSRRPSACAARPSAAIGAEMLRADQRRDDARRSRSRTAGRRRRTGSERQTAASTIAHGNARGDPSSPSRPSRGCTRCRCASPSIAVVRPQPSSSRIRHQRDDARRAGLAEVLGVQARARDALPRGVEDRDHPVGRHALAAQDVEDRIRVDERRPRVAELADPARPARRC